MVSAVWPLVCPLSFLIYAVEVIIAFVRLGGAKATAHWYVPHRAVHRNIVHTVDQLIHNIVSFVHHVCRFAGIMRIQRVVPYE